jgi:hypothetical protein
LKQSALYIHQYVLPDPLFPFTKKRSETNNAIASYLGFKSDGLDRHELVRAVKYLKTLTPMVAANYVKLLPVSILFEPPEQPPIYHSDNQFSDLLPSELLEFFRARAIVRSLRQVDKEWVVDNDLIIGRAITIEFRDHKSSDLKVQFLFQPEFTKLDDSGHFGARLFIPPDLPSPEMFEGWVTQSVNRASSDIYQELRTEVRMARQLGASLLTDSILISNLLTRFFPSGPATATHTANLVLNVELPFFDNLDTDRLMSIRTNDGEAFENFRNELDKQLWDLRFESDPDRLRSKAQKVFHDLGTVQTHLLRMKAQDLRKGALAQAVILSATFAGTLVAAGLTPIAPIVAAAGMAKAAADYRTALRANPAFFLWKALGG